MYIYLSTKLYEVQKIKINKRLVSLIDFVWLQIPKLLLVFLKTEWAVEAAQVLLERTQLLAYP